MSTEVIPVRLSLVLAVAFLSAGCNGGGDDPTVDPCADIFCKAHSYCQEGDCICNDGFHEEGGSCLPDDPCRFVICDDNRHCEDGFCQCDDGYQMQGGECVSDDACAGITCDSGEQCLDGVCVPELGECCDHGTLDETGAEPVCQCETGYNDLDGDLLCGPDDPADWPPAVDDLYNGAELLGQAECLLPDCHQCGHPGDFDPSGLWTRHSHTTSSTCQNPLVNGYDARTVVGNQTEETDLELGLFLGTCRWDTTVTPRREAGTMINDVLTGCVINERLMNIYSVEYEIVSYDPASDTLSGPAKVYVIGTEEMPEFGVPCQFEMELTYTRQ